MIPTGIQIQVDVIITGERDDLKNRNTVGFGFKVAILTAGGGGFSVYPEKPPKSGKSDTLVFCLANLKETEPACINLGFLLWLKHLK